MIPIVTMEPTEKPDNGFSVNGSPQKHNATAKAKIGMKHSIPSKTRITVSVLQRKRTFRRFLFTKLVAIRKLETSVSLLSIFSMIRDISPFPARMRIWEKDSSTDSPERK